MRKLAGIGFPGYTWPEVSLIGRVTLPDAVIVAGSGDAELPGLGRVRLTQQQRTPRGMYSIAPLTSLDVTAAKGTYIVWTREDADSATPAGPGDREPPVTLAELQASFRRVTGADVTMTEPTWLTRTVANSRQADRYLEGRVLLAGDAAHLSGVGGSLNTGLLDAINLGWKLAAQVQGRAPAGLLASYHAERHAAGRRALLQTRAQRALTGSGEAADALREVLGELLTLPGVARHFGEMVAGSDIRYDMPGSSTRPHPLTGRLAPDLRLTTPDGDSTRVAEMMRAARPLLLDFTPGGRVAAQAAGPDQPVPALVAESGGRPDRSRRAADPPGRDRGLGKRSGCGRPGGWADGSDARLVQVTEPGCQSPGPRRHADSAGAAVTAVPAGVDLARVPQMPAVEVGEQGVQEHHLGVRRLPEQEVRGPLLPRRPDEQVHVRDLRLVQVAADDLLVDLLRLQLVRQPRRGRSPWQRRRSRPGRRS